MLFPVPLVGKEIPRFVRICQSFSVCPLEIPLALAKINSPSPAEHPTVEEPRRIHRILGCSVRNAGVCMCKHRTCVLGTA